MGPISGDASSTWHPRSEKTRVAPRQIEATTGSTGAAPPRSGVHATRHPRISVRWGSAAQSSPVSGKERGSRGSGPTMTENINAASATVRVIGPCIDIAFQAVTLGYRATRPCDGLNPTTPHHAAGWRIEPARSPPSASGPSPAATAAAAPPLDPPGERDTAHGLTVAPN